ncbi:hypothetical protein ACLB2K_025814 [Fragaria x ananassa]
MFLKKLQFLLLLLLPFSVTPLTFNFPSFPPAVTSNIFMEGDAFLDGFLRLTKSAVDVEKNQSVGRATYHQPFFLRQNATGKLSDFTSNFTFVIDSLSKTSYGDGLAFFIAPNGSLLNSSIGKGGSLGLPVINTMNTLSGYEFPFVAVEFDIFQNVETWILDPPGDHVGIDVDSTKSLVTKAWNGNLVNGAINSATVSYDSVSKNISVRYTSYVSGRQVMRNVRYTVDLGQYLPDCVIVGFSAATGAQTALHKINSWSFHSTSLLDENNASIVQRKKGNPNVGLEVGLVVGGVVVLAGVMCLVWFVFCKMRGAGESDDEDPVVYDSIDDEFEKGTGPRKFAYRKLVRATSNFVETEKLGEGGFGGVYKGFIKELDSHVAVKRVSRGSKQGVKEYAAEVRIISRLRHRNLVQLIGWCHEKRELLLVYEFMPNGSLDTHLFKAKSLLAWDARYRIAQGLASGLFYLHEEWEQCVLHRDIKSSNVMLDSNFNAKLGDFGLARLVDHGKQSQTTVLAGTLGYMAPECTTTGKSSKESDVYSFGIVALEIACGRKPVDVKFGRHQINMVEWVWELYGEGKVIEAADPKLCGEFDKKQMECLLIVGLWCVHPDCNTRPSMQQAIQVLNSEVSLPILPSKMPVACYIAAPVSFSMVSSNTSDLVRGQTKFSGHNTNASQFTTTSASSSSPSTSLLHN